MNEAALHELLSGRRKDLGATLLRSGLSAAEWLYWLVISIRNLAYDRKWLRQHHVSVPIISVGNITTGGTGKTPFAAWLANWLKDHGRKPGLISRGYHSLAGISENQSSDSPIVNDEKLVLDRLCPDVPHLQQRDRVVSAKRAIREFGCDSLLLDDGFQHRRLQRNLDLVLIDALKPWGYGHLLPRGLLREPLRGLSRADLIVLTRADQCTPEHRQQLTTQIRAYCPQQPIIEVGFSPTRLVDLNWQPHLLNEVQGLNILAFCGIGNPEGFRQTASSLGASVVTLREFPDHHHYRDDDFAQLAKMAAECGVNHVLTTQKDLVKIDPHRWQGPTLLAVEIGVRFLSGESELTSRLQQILS